MLQRHHIGRRLASCALAAALVAQGTPTAALAVTSAELQSQLDAAQEELDSLGHQVQAAGEDLHETQYQLEVTGEQIEETKGLIEQRQAELDEAQEILSRRVASNYKVGKTSLASILLASSSFNELIANVYYANKVYQQDAEAIDSVKEARTALEEEQTALEEKQAEQEELLEQQEAQIEQLKEQEAAQAEYVDNLDAEVVAKLEEERQAELERQRKEAEEAAARAAAEAEAAAKREAEEAAARAAAEARAQESAEGSQADTPTEVTSSTGGPSASQRNTIISAAYTQVGVPYSFGSCSPGSGFDCSGFVMWCYAQAGISLPHSSAAQCGISTSVSYSQLQPGDLVFWMGTGGASTGGNHVAIYLGNGMIIHANYNGVEAVSLYSGVTSYGVIG
jgi:cell wall-associated NlpC family hydrolase